MNEKFQEFLNLIDVPTRKWFESSISEPYHIDCLWIATYQYLQFILEVYYNDRRKFTFVMYEEGDEGDEVNSITIDDINVAVEFFNKWSESIQVL